MKIRFLGTGGAFHVEQGNSAAVVTAGAHTFLLDCGHSVFPRLVNTGLVHEIDAVLVTHLHDDHVGSLSSLILYFHHVLKREKLTIVYQSEAFLSLLKDFLSFSLGRPENRVNFVPISDYPEVQAIDTFGQHVRGMSTWGFCFREGNESIAYSGDLGNPDSFFARLDEMKLPGKPLVFHEMAFVDSFGHTWYKQLEPYRDRYHVYGYHHDPRENPEDNVIPLVAETPEFLV